ncbi:uncharacterized protein PGTG_20975 [Puccinia graminis f. sp. tritici CRL 75-36-700-3]|uniref:Uncharacterized protein n=1 Tax=Puccinia graminis f. sp. tritici (strain CRL 75-36-700-3 / race SCCL) TaxID=418459 RepID=H6QPZ0_PUCGT|nr:uncharacterized protein PGTG_20975 [Puccinia graminis f. sp. tritici CRL 75-36-700-3]EHS64513.1 hypothetical protein PGTG_20975 [Puccinia graminis f. sp. tritici CRL 75-36-700-3]
MPQARLIGQKRRPTKPPPQAGPPGGSGLMLAIRQMTKSTFIRVTASSPSLPANDMDSRSSVLDRTVVQVAGDALPMTLHLSYHVWITQPGGDRTRYPSPHAQIGLDWIETIGPKAGVQLSFVDDPRSWTLPDFQEAVIQKIQARSPDVALVILAQHHAKDLTWEIIRTGPEEGPLLSSKIDHPWEWTIQTRSITQASKEFKYTVHVTGVEPQPTTWRSHMTGRGAITQRPGGHARRSDPFVDLYLQYTIYAPLGPTRDGETYYQSFSRDHPGVRKRLDFTGLSFPKLKAYILSILNSEKRSAAIDALAEDADLTCDLRWHYSIVDPGYPELQGTFDTSQPACSDAFSQAVLASSRHAKTTLVIRMPYEHRVILPLPLPSRRIYSGNKRPKLEDPTRHDELADDASEEGPSDSPGDRLTIPAFL